MSEMNLYNQALLIAVRAHDHQRRKDPKTKEDKGPYVQHPIRVAQAARDLALKHHGKLHPKTGAARIMATAVLHDVIEDARPGFVTEIYNLDRQIHGWVSALSRPGEVSYMDWITDMASGADPEVKIIKLADLRDNMSDLPEGDSRLKRYKKAEKILLESLE